MDNNNRLPNEPNIFFDEPCQKIAVFLKERLNEAVVRSNTKPAIYDCASNEIPITDNFQIVNGIRSWKDRSVPNMEYPLLKVYRIRDNFQSNKTMRETSGVISYSLIMPNQLALTPILQWVSYEINYYLIDSYQRIGIFISETGRSAEYITEAGSPSFEHLNFYITFNN